MTELRYGGANPAEIIAWQRAIVAFAPSYARRPDGTPLRADGWIGGDDAKVAAEYRARRKLPAPPKGIVVTDDEYAALVGKWQAPAPPRARHLAVVFRGTGGIIGQDYVSLVCQRVADLYEERNPNFPASMGGIPVGAASDVSAPSGAKSVDIGVEAGKVEITNALTANPKRMVAIGGYSLGAIAAAKLREWMMATHPANYLCSFSFGDPTRPFGGSYYLGPIPAGQGISSWRYGDVHDYRHCWLTHWGDADMYTDIPLGVVGDIMDDFFDSITGIELSDPLTLVTKMLPILLQTLPKAGIELPMILGAVAGGIPGLAVVALPILLGMLPGLIGGQDPRNLTGPAAAAAAAVIALKFLIAGTGPHIRYSVDLAPGLPITYLDLAVQHMRDYGSRTPAA